MALNDDEQDHRPDGMETAIGRAGHAFIAYPRVQRLHEAIRRCQRLSALMDEAQCMSLEGPLGAGKTKVSKRYARAFPRRQEDDRTIVPVFYVETPSPVTIKGAALAMAGALGDRPPVHTPQYEIDRQLVAQLRGCKTELVILDDFHHLIPKSKRRDLNPSAKKFIALDVADWLKVLIKESGVPFLVVGLIDTIAPIMEADRELGRLFAARETLAPFSWDPANDAAMQEFAQFIEYAEQAIDLPLAPDVPRRELLALLHRATDGVVANVMNLLRYAQVDALDLGRTVITQADLGAAYQSRLSAHMGKRKNPFTATGR